MTSNSSNPRELDVIVWGATGFTGRLVAAYLLERYGTDGELRWAIGGRDAVKLERLRGELGGKIPVLAADPHDPAAMDAVVVRARVVCSTAGPFAKYGTELVAACARHGTHYCDIAGEVHWIRRMIDAYEGAARASGARIVHCCGFDSIPSDLGCLYLNEAMRARHGRPCSEVKLRVARIRGGFSGGTIASMLDVLERARVDRTMQDPYALDPAGERSGPDGPDPRGPAWDADVGSWTAPFMMAGINTRVVRRSNALLDYAYGRAFRYSEAMMMGRGLPGWVKATGMTAALGAFFALAYFRPTRRLLVRFVLPRPGEGPSARERSRGFFDFLLVGKSDDARLRARVRGDRDPGYGATSRMLGESAVCLALDEEKLTAGGGVWTPASCLGVRLIERLERSAGMSFSLEAD